MYTAPQIRWFSSAIVRSINLLTYLHPSMKIITIVAWLGTNCSFQQLLIIIREYISLIALILSVISSKTGINYPDLELGNKFSCYKSLANSEVNFK